MLPKRQRSHPRGPSAPRRRAHKPFPLVEATAKTKLAGLVVAEARRHLATLAAFRVVRGSILASRNENVRCQRVLFRFHFSNRLFDFSNGLAQLFECLVKPSGAHKRELNMFTAIRQFRGMLQQELTKGAGHRARWATTP